MKSFLKLNIFRSKKHQKDDKDNLDTDNIKRQKQTPKRRRSITDLSNPASAYHVPTQPRSRRPTQSCFEQIQSHEPPSSSGDDQCTLLNDRASAYNLILAFNQ